MQEELIASKLREAEANLSLKELEQKVIELKQHWQVCACAINSSWAIMGLIRG